jgi:hypothetical protein
MLLLPPQAPAPEPATAYDGPVREHEAALLHVRLHKAAVGSVSAQVEELRSLLSSAAGAPAGGDGLHAGAARLSAEVAELAAHLQSLRAPAANFEAVAEAARVLAVPAAELDKCAEVRDSALSVRPPPRALSHHDCRVNLSSDKFKEMLGELKGAAGFFRDNPGYRDAKIWEGKCG